MTSPLKSLIASGTKLWLDSIDPDLVAQQPRARAPPAPTSNPIIIADLIKTGRFDDDLDQTSCDEGLDDDADRLAADRPAGPRGPGGLPAGLGGDASGDDGYVSFELDPLLEDPASKHRRTPSASKRYIELGKKWSAGHKNRMIKVPGDARRPRRARGTGRRRRDAQRDADLLASGSTTPPATPSGAARSGAGEPATASRAVYSIFVSRLDVYTEKHVPRAVAGGPGHGRHRQRQADLAR